MKTILITGGAGFIGSNLTAALLARGSHHVVVCDRFGTGEKWRNLSKHAPYEIIDPDLLFPWLEANQHQVEMIFHLGSISSTVEQNVDLVLKHNFALSLSLWRWCTEHGVRMLYASAAATYGDGSQGFDDTLDLDYLRRLKPMSGYGWSKHLFDMHVAGAYARGEIGVPQWVGLKFFNSYGPNEYHKDDQRSVITKMAQHVVQGGTVKLFRSHHPQYKDGDQKRDVIYVKDMARVMLWMLDNPHVSGLFNLGTGKASTFNDMANALFAAANRPPHIHYIDMPEELVSKYQYFTEAKMDRLRAAGYDAPFTSLTDGTRDYLQQYLMKKDDIYL